MIALLSVPIVFSETVANSTSIAALTRQRNSAMTVRLNPFAGLATTLDLAIIANSEWDAFSDAKTNSDLIANSIPFALSTTETNSATYVLSAKILFSARNVSLVSAANSASTVPLALVRASGVSASSRHG